MSSTRRRAGNRRVTLPGPSGDPRVFTVARYRTRAGEDSEWPCDFAASEWALFDRFVSYANVLATTTLMASPRALQFELKADETGEVSFGATSVPTPDEVRALLHVLRPFVLKKEPTNFGRVGNALQRQLGQSNLSAYLEMARRRFNISGTQPWTMMANGMVVNSDATLDLWLNAYQYHRDEDKQQRLDSLIQNQVVPIEYYEATFIGLLLDKARAVIEVRNLIVSLQRNVIPSAPVTDQPTGGNP